MKVAITIEIDTTASFEGKIIQELSEDISLYFQNKNYGDGFLNYYIRCICIKTLPGYEAWYRPRKPRYKKLTVLKDLKVDGSDITIRNFFSCDFKIDNEEYDEFVAAPDDQCRLILCKKIITSLDSLNSLSSKVVDFNKTSFTNDFIAFLK